MFFMKPKKKSNTALKIVAIATGVVAAVAAGYVIFTKLIQPKLAKKKAADDCCCDCECDEIIEIVESDDAIEVDETEAEEILADEE